MLPTSLAIAWPLWRRHRWGLLITLGYLLSAAVATCALTTGPIDPNIVNAILFHIALMLSFLGAYLVTIFSLGFDANVSTRESCFPPALFRLPVRTVALVGWLMAYGATAAVLLWLVTALFILRPWLSLWDMTVPLWWPAALLVASLAWFQAVLWVPLGMPVLRIVLIAFLVPVLIVLPQLSLQARVSEEFLLGLFGCLAAGGWTLGFAGVKYARSGGMLNWDIRVRPWFKLIQRLPRRKHLFANAFRAHVWFECRRNGWILPTLSAVTLPFVLEFLLFGKNDAIPTTSTLLSALAIPIFWAGLAGTIVSGKNPWVKDYYGVAPFTATLPMSTADIVAAKLKAAAWSTLATWTLLAVAIPLTVLLTGHREELTELWRRELGDQPPLKVALGIGAALIWLMVWTWKRLVDSLLLGLTGRKWIIQGTLYAGVIGFFTLFGIALFVYKNPELQEASQFYLPWLLGLWVLCRLLLTAWAVRQVLHQNLVKPRTLRRWLLAWLLLGSFLFGIFAWIVPRELVAYHYLIFTVVLVLPMAHLAATPLALAWNRHR